MKKLFFHQPLVILCLILSTTYFSCSNSESVPPIHSKPLLTSQWLTSQWLTNHTWRVSEATFSQTKDMSDFLSPKLARQLADENYDYKHVRDCYYFMNRIFPCLLDNTIHFGENSITIDPQTIVCSPTNTPPNYIELEKVAPLVTSVTQDTIYSASFFQMRTNAKWKLNTADRTINFTAATQSGDSWYYHTMWTITDMTEISLKVETMAYFFIYETRINPNIANVSSSLKRINLTLTRID